MRKPVRLRDFIEDLNGCLYAVSAYDNSERVGCILRYVPDPVGERVNPEGRRYRKLDFEEAFDWVRENKPEYLDLVHRVPVSDISCVLKPEEELEAIGGRDRRVRDLAGCFNLPEGALGCTGSFLCGLENEGSDIDLVVYGDAWSLAQRQLRDAVEEGVLDAVSDDMWQRIYSKRVPEIAFGTFVLHEERKLNRGEIDGTYFDLLFTRGYDTLNAAPVTNGEVLGRKTIEAKVTDASLSFDSPAIYEVEHEVVSRVVSFTHTYSGQARQGETIEACGVCEQHNDEQWLIVGTTREAKGEYIISLTLMEE